MHAIENAKQDQYNQYVDCNISHVPLLMLLVLVFPNEVTGLSCSMKLKKAAIERYFVSSYFILHLFGLKSNKRLNRPSLLFKVFVFPFCHFTLNRFSFFKVTLFELVSSIFKEIEHFTLLKGKLNIKDIICSLLLSAITIVL